MKDLMTRRIILGLLMGLVLGFGVPGVVDAVRDPKLKQSSSDFFKFRTPNTTFSFSVSLPFDVAENSASSPETVTITFSSGITPIGIFQGETSPITLTEKGGRDADSGPPVITAANGNEYSFGTDKETNSTTITIQGRFNNTGSTGEQTVAISSTGWTEGNTSANTYTYYYYVSNANGASANTIQLGTTVGTFSYFDGSSGSGYATGVFEGSTSQIFAGESTLNVPVLYTNRGRLQMSHANYKAGERVSLPGSGPIASNFAIHLRDNTSTDVVTAQVRGHNTPIITGVYIYGYPTLEVDGLTKSEKGGMENPGKPGELIQNAFTATVKDQKGNAVPGVPVKFTRTVAPGTLVFGSGNTGTLVQENNDVVTSNGNPINAGSGVTLYVRTSSSGKASVSFRLGDGESTVTVDAVAAIQATLKAYGGSVAGKELSALRTREGLENNTFDLYALVTYDGEAVDVSSTLPDTVTATDFDVIFRTDDGTLTNTSSATPGTGPEVKETPNSDGVAEVEFKWDGSSSNPQVTASLQETVQGVTRDIQTVTFDITGSRPSPPSPQPSGTQPARLDISVFGEDGDTSRAVIVNARNSAGQTVSISIPITLSGTALVTSQTVNTGAVTTITPPTDPDTYTLIATDPAGNYASATETITVEGPAGEGTLDVTTVGTPVDGQQTIEVTVEDADGEAPEGEVIVTLTGPGISRTVDTVNGTGRAIIRLPNTATYTLRLSADGYATRSVTLSVSGVVQDDTETQTRDTTPTPGGGARSVRIASEPFPSGTANRQLAQPMRVQVLDANNNGVSNVRVTFEVVSGQGRLSQRGNGRAIRVQTDRNGNASANYTPLADGTSRVRATAAGVTQTVTFTITAGAAAPSPEETTPRETEVTPSREINPDVHVGAANRPPMLWVDGGAIYALVGADVERFVPGVDNALNIAVGGGKVYWTEQTGESSGTINSANLDGSGMTELVETRWSVPMGIAVDTARSRLYWSNSSGKIKRANLNGSGITNVMQDLRGVRDIAVARGNLYWTQYDATEEEGNVGIVNPNAAQKIARYIPTGSDTPGSIAIGGNTVYWTEMTGESSGTINSANLNGSGMTELVETRWSVPMGIAVDTARSRLYWSNSSGKIKNANLTGKQGRLVVDGLGMPGDMVLSNSIEAPAKAPTTDAEQTAATSKYDINGDGAVDSKDVDALIVAVAAGVTDAKYDVNGDGKVDIFDVSAVSSKRDAGAAAAPALLGTNLSIVQIDRLQEQIDLLVASNDRSPDTLRLLTYLHQLIVMARPEKTQLLANYPNPFNPETWIPYELATDTTVKITIYNTQGVVIRTLELGHQSAGYYTDRERAAYWDGRNALGEQVASGIYFYQFETDELSSLRKMVILK